MAAPAVKPRPEASRRAGEPKIIGAFEAAEIIGCRQSNLRDLKGLPRPYAYIKAGTLWREYEIVAFAEKFQQAKEAAAEPPVILATGRTSPRLSPKAPMGKRAGHASP